MNPLKAYKNSEFLSSPQARTIRILSEFLEPQLRFRIEGIKDTIVFFGSSRILSTEIAKKQLHQLKIKFNNSKQLTQLQKEKLHIKETDLLMSKYYEDACQLSSLITKWSKSLDGDRRFVIASGGGPGIMEAANRGARKVGGKSVGLNISLPHEQGPNKYISKNLSFEFHYFFMRKFWFIYLAKALVMFPGGFGTMDEMWEVLTLIQTKKVKKYLPIVLYGSRYWNDVINFEALVNYGMISKKDMKLFRFADTPEEAFNLLKKELSNYI